MNHDPKQEAGNAKPPMWLIPPAASEQMALALKLGATKYGQWNWREHEVLLSTYLSAIKRHIDQILDGEDFDAESGAHHLGHVMAGCGIILDASKWGTLVDDRVLPLKLQSRESA